MAQPVRQWTVAETAVRVSSLNLPTPHQARDGGYGAMNGPTSIVPLASRLACLLTSALVG